MSIQEFMTDDLSKVAEFEAACNEMIGLRYILAEGKIIKILQIVATSTVLQRIIGTALKGFDYAEVARQWNGGSVKPPVSEKDQVAFAFCVLADIDSHKIVLSDFLRKFFWNGDINSSFADFCVTLIEPFKNYVVGALNRVNEKSESVKVDIETKAMKLADAIDSYNGFSQTDKEEYIFMCDNIASKAKDDLSGARALAVALKKLVGDIPEIEPAVADIIGELGY